MNSFNRKIVCEPYVSKGAIESEVKKGMTFIKQKSKIIGLKVLMDAQIDQNLIIPKGSFVYILEEILYNQTAYQKPLTSEVVETPFVVVDFGHVIFAGDN
jgi:hypothetical protein